MKIKLQKGLFIGDYPLSQLFGEHPEWIAPPVYYEVFGLKGHNGIDYAVPTGTVLTSCINGTVIENEYDAGGYGNYIKIENDYCGVLYAHMKKKSDYQPGMQVVVGADIGVSGNTGNSTGPHLHFGVFSKPRDRSNGYAGYIDPLDKNLVEWVDSLDENLESIEIEKLKEELDDMRTSRNNWRTLCNEREGFIESLAKDVGLEDFDVNKDPNSLSEEVNRISHELTTIYIDSVSFSLLGKQIFVFVRNNDEVIEGGVEND